MEKIKIQLKIEIEIVEIEVTKDWFEIYYKYSIDDGAWVNDMVDGDYDNGDSPEEWKKSLQDGIAREYVLEDVKEIIF